MRKFDKTNALKPPSYGHLSTQESRAPLLLGAHVSIAGGVHRAIGKARIWVVLPYRYSQKTLHSGKAILLLEEVKKFKRSVLEPGSWLSSTMHT
jgi:hypothetical protein